MPQWITRTRRSVLDCGKFLKVEQHEVELPDGQVIPDWMWVITPDYVNIVIVTEDNRFLLFRQTKYGIEGQTLATAGGYIEPGEAPLDAARRETLEETGYEALTWIDLGCYRVDGNRGAGLANFFLATGAHRVTHPDADDLEDQEMLLLTREEVESALRTGEFKVLAWAAIVALALMRLSENR